MSQLDAIKARAGKVTAKPENREATFAEFAAVIRLAHFDVPVLVAAVEAVLYAPREAGHDLYLVSLDYQNGYNTALADVTAAIQSALGEEEK